MPPAPLTRPGGVTHEEGPLMSIADTTRVVTSPSAPSDELGALQGTVGNPELVGLLTEAFALGVRAARLHPVCDWCSEPVVAANLGWCHQATARYGCEPEALWSCVAQVDGSLYPAPAPEPCSDPVANGPHYGDVRDCPRCGMPTWWTGYGWEHASHAGDSGTLSCDR